MTEWKVGDKAWIKSYVTDVREIECLVVTPNGIPMWWDGISCLELPVKEIYVNKLDAVMAVAQKLRDTATDFRNEAMARLILAAEHDKKASAFLLIHGINN